MFRLVDQMLDAKGCTVYEGQNGVYDQYPIIVDTAECGLPAITHPTSESQSMGTIENVDQTRVDNMITTITCEPSIIQSKMHGYGVKDYMIKWGQQMKLGNGTGFRLVPFVAYIKGTIREESGNNVQTGNNTTGTVSINTYFYRLTCDGKEIRYVDKLKGILKINGIDYRAELESML